MQHCLESFRGGMTVATAVEELVWAHQEGPAEAREMATDFFVRNRKAIRVRAWRRVRLCWCRSGGWGVVVLLACTLAERERAKQGAWVLGMLHAGGGGGHVLAAARIGRGCGV